MMLDPSLAFTALIEMRPGLADPGGQICADLARAMTAANPRDRWAFARGWLDTRHPLPALAGPLCAVYCAHRSCIAITEERVDAARSALAGVI